MQYINKYAFLYPGVNTPNTRIWISITIKEFQAYLGVSI